MSVLLVKAIWDKTLHKQMKLEIFDGLINGSPMVSIWADVSAILYWFLSTWYDIKPYNIGWFWGWYCRCWWQIWMILILNTVGRSRYRESFTKYSLWQVKATIVSKYSLWCSERLVFPFDMSFKKLDIYLFYPVNQASWIYSNNWACCIKIYSFR